MSQEKIWVSIEGLIGSGKSTYIKRMLPYLEAHFGKGSVAIVKEPVDDWSEYLSKYATDPVRYSFLFQIYAFHTRQKEFNQVMQDNPSATIFISERSPLTDRYVFWDANSALYPLDRLEIDTYPLLWETWQKLYPMSLSKMIYLDLPLDTCESRIKERNRDSEVGSITIKYQELLRKKHEILFEYTDIPYTVISSRVNYRDNEEITKNCAQQLINEIKIKT